MTFAVAKIFWLLAKPSNLIVLLLLVGVALLWLQWWRLGTALVSLAALPLLLLAFVPLGSWLMVPLENRFPAPDPPPADVSGIVVLSGPEQSHVSAARGQPALGGAAERLHALMELAHRYPQARLVYTGGSGGLLGSRLTSAAIARDLLERARFDVDRVLFEERARDTWENAVFSQALARPGSGERWLLVTSASHMPRAVGIFREIGWPVIPWPVDYRTAGGLELDPGAGVGRALADLDEAMREWIGLVAYRLLGRTGALFPSP